MQRMADCIVHGQFGEALLCNPYLAAISPYILAVAAAELSGRRAPRFKAAVENRRVAIILAIAMFGWWILRNTAMWHSFTGR